MIRLSPVYMLPLMMASLLLGIAGGWLRLGYVGLPLAPTAAMHGALMLGSFMSSLIVLERAMVMPQRAWLIFPLVNVGSAIPFLLGNWTLGSTFLLIGSFGLFAMMYLQISRFKMMYLWVMGIGAAGLVAGNGLLLIGFQVPKTLPYWVFFILLTIVGERMELSKFMPVSAPARKTLLVLLGLFLGFTILPFHSMAAYFQGATLLGIAIWLLRYDMARLLLAKTGQFQYIGWGLVSGYFWLALAALIAVFQQGHPLQYDLYIHAFFLGFAFSMIWAHAPIVFPLVINRKVDIYHPAMWVGWIFFQTTLLLRIFGGLFQNFDLRKWAAVANGYSIVAMFVLMAGIQFFRFVFKNRHSSTTAKRHYA